MKILMVTPGRLPVPARKGGAVETLIELLLEYNENGPKRELHILALEDAEAKKLSEKYQFSIFHFVKIGKLLEIASANHFLPYRMIDFFFSKKGANLLLNKNLSFEKIIIQNELVNGVVISKKIPGTYFYHAHNDTLKEKNKADCRFLESCEKVISISNFLGEQFRKKANLQNTYTMYNGVDVNLFNHESHYRNGRELRKKYGIPEDEVVIVFAGRIVPEKGIKELLEAFLRIPAEKKVTLLILGSSFFESSRENSFVKEMKEIAKEKQEKIIFSGYIKHDEMPDYYSMADIGCVPSIWDEPFGLSVVEQMAMELPVIVTDSGAIPEIVNKNCGIVVHRNQNLSGELEKAILELCDVPEKRKAFGRAGRIIAEKAFSQQKFCEQWFEVINQGE